MENNEGNTGVEIPIWYTENEMHQWLIRENYSEKIAKELSGKYATYLQGAFNKGYEKGSRENAALITALKDLIPIAEFLKSEYPIDFFLYFKESAIDNAKKLINPTAI